MQLSQSALFRLSCASFLAGLFLSLLLDLLYMTQLWAVPSNIRYSVPAVQRLRPQSKAKKERSKSQKGVRISVFLGDVLFCIAGALTLILLLYWFNNGAFRAAAPLCMALGFWACHISLSKGVRIVLQWLAFGIERALLTLLLPVKWVMQIYKKKAQKRRLVRLAKIRQGYTKKQLQSLEKAAEGLLPIETRNRMQKGEERAKQRKKAV